MVPPLDDGGYLSPEAELHALVTAFPDVGFILDADGQYVQVLTSSETGGSLFDDPEALIGSHVEDVFDPALAETFMANVEEAVETGDLQEFEYGMEVPEGERYFEARVAPVPDAEESALAEGSASPDGSSYVVYVARDVTEERRRRRDIARQHSYMQAMLDSLDDVFYALDRQGNLVDWNRTVEQVSGYDGEELAACALADVFGADAEKRLAAFVDEVVQNGSARRVTEVETKSGVRIPYEFVASLFEDPRGEDLVVGIGRDVSERMEREEQVRVFGRVLRHNMRNKMTVVEGTAEYIDEHRGDGRLSPEVQRIQRAARDLVRLTEKAHDATEILLKATDTETLDLDGILRGLVGEYRSRYPAVAFAYDDEAGATVEAIPAVELAFEELVENAAEHSSASPAISSQDAAEHSSASPATPSQDAGEHGSTARDPDATGRRDGGSRARENVVASVSTAVESGVAGDGGDRGAATPPDSGENDGDSGVPGTPSARVEIDVESDDDAVRVRVRDDGPGLPEHEANIITEHREMSTVYHASGIGLWLVRWIVKRSRGDLRLDRDDEWTTITVELPRGDADGN